MVYLIALGFVCYNLTSCYQHLIFLTSYAIIILWLVIVKNDITLAIKKAVFKHK